MTMTAGVKTNQHKMFHILTATTTFTITKTKTTMKMLTIFTGLLSYHVISGAVYQKELEVLDSLPPKEDRREPLRLQPLPGKDFFSLFSIIILLFCLFN